MKANFYLSEESRKRANTKKRIWPIRPIRNDTPLKNSKERGAYNMKVQQERVVKEIELLKSEGFRCINIVGVRPDIIAIKENKVFAIEVEYGRPNKNKYTKEISEQYDEIRWIIKRFSKNNLS